MNKCFLFHHKSFFLLVLLAGTQAITVKILTDISKSKDNQVILVGQVIEYNVRNIFLWKACRK